MSETTYTAGEAIKALGISRHTFNGRCRMLCIRMENSYTEDDIYRIASYVPQYRKPDADRADALRERLNRRLAEDNTGLRIEQDNDGTYALKAVRAEGGRRGKTTAGRTAKSPTQLQLHGTGNGLRSTTRTV